MFELIRVNQRRTVVLTVAMAALLAFGGYAVAELVQPGAGLGGVVAGVALWIVLALLAYYAGDDILLGLAGARRIDKQHHPVLFNVVEEMSIAAGLSKPPAVYIVDQATPNAFAVGRDPARASVAVTAGLLERLDRDELQGVVAHELSHVKHRDVLYLMMLGVMAGAVVILADIGRRVFFYGGGRRRTSSKRDGGGIIVLIALLFVILGPLVAQLLYFAISRRREYLADAGAATLTRYPEGLASALEKIAFPPLGARSAEDRLALGLQRIAESGQPGPGSTVAAALLGGDEDDAPRVHRMLAPMYTVDPLASSGSSAFSTHPPVAERIKILRAMGHEASLASYEKSFRSVTRRPVGVIPFGALEREKARPEARPAAEDATRRLERVRAATDALWLLNQFVFVACGCGTKLKIPPVYAGREIACPHCQTLHKVATAAS